MDQDGAKRIERRSANRRKPAECISEIRYRILDAGGESLRCLFERHTMGWHTDEWQSVQATTRIRLAHPHREGRRPRRNTHPMWEPSEKPIATGRRSQTGRTANQPPANERYHPVDFLWGFREGGGVVVDARNPLPVAVGR